MRKKDLYNYDELSAAISAAVNAALDAREAKKKTVLIQREVAAKRLNVDVTTLWRWQRAGYLPKSKIAGKVYVPEEAIIQLENGEMTA